MNENFSHLRLGNDLCNHAAAPSFSIFSGPPCTDDAPSPLLGAFWAALTHARCDVLLGENAVLARELGQVPECGTRFISEKPGEIEQLAAPGLRTCSSVKRAASGTTPIGK